MKRFLFVIVYALIALLGCSGAIQQFECRGGLSGASDWHRVDAESLLPHAMMAISANVGPYQNPPNTSLAPNTPRSDRSAGRARVTFKVRSNTIRGIKPW